MSTPPTLRLAHLSDVHITLRALGWTWRDFLSKRVAGWANLNWLGRGHRFRQADEVLAVLCAELRQRRPEHVVFSGDASALGFEKEMARAAAILGVGAADALPGIAVPGNHDYYLPAVASSGYFEKHFAPWQHGERVEGARYPFAQRVGGVWLIGVNSCTGNRWVLNASGRTGTSQLQRLARLLDSLQGAGPRVLVTHYPVCKADGLAEDVHHRLHDARELAEVATRGKVNLWLHGHRHAPYHIADKKILPFPIICAGSATQSGLWSYGEYEIAGWKLRASRRAFVPELGAFQERECFELDLER